MLTYICDRCGKVIRRPAVKGIDEPIRHVIDWGYADYDDPEGCADVESIDVCNNCYTSFLLWKDKWQETDEMMIYAKQQQEI